MFDQISNFRQVRVIVDLARSGAYVSVIARRARGGNLRDALLIRERLPDSEEWETVEDILREAARAVNRAADRL
jgi:hypothetical protein